MIAGQDRLSAIGDDLTLGRCHCIEPARALGLRQKVGATEDLAVGRGADVEAVGTGGTGRRLAEGPQSVRASCDRLSLQGRLRPLRGDLVQPQQIALQGEPVDHYQTVGGRVDLERAEEAVQARHLRLDRPYGNKTQRRFKRPQGLGPRRGRRPYKRCGER